MLNWFCPIMGGQGDPSPRDATLDPSSGQEVTKPWLWRRAVSIATVAVTLVSPTEMEPPIGHYEIMISLSWRWFFYFVLYLGVARRIKTGWVLIFYRYSIVAASSCRFVIMTISIPAPSKGPWVRVENSQLPQSTGETTMVKTIKSVAMVTL